MVMPSHPSHAQYDLCQTQMGSGGTVLSPDLVGGQPAAFRFMNALQIAVISNNLGDANTIVTHPATAPHQRPGEDQRAALGITPGMVRFSVGLEDANDLIGDALQALT